MSHRRVRPAALAALALLATYVVLGFLVADPRGYLGTDTGGKVATFRAMEDGGRLDPAVGYWAEADDPEGDLHPLFYTARFGDRWVNVTTLPALYAGYPLYRLGGYRAALLVPMVGAVVAALAARALARRLRPTFSGWWAFALAGLASPVTIYALDFWEHTWGVALMGWGAVVALDLARSSSRSAAGTGAVAGLLFGAAATLRTEALVYGAIIVAVALGARVATDRRVRPALLAGGAAVAGVAVPVVANLAVERAVLGDALRSDRARAALGAAGSGGANRVEEALVTLFGIAPDLAPATWLAGALIGVGVAAVVAVVTRTPPTPSVRRIAATTGGVVLVLYLARASSGLGFVPGLVASTPLAAAGLLAPARLTAGRMVLAFALLPLPVVWAFQYTGGALPQWGGRYILLSGFLLATAGVTVLEDATVRARAGGAALAAAVTVFGLGWLAVRADGVAEVGRQVAGERGPVVFRLAHLARELGGFYSAERRWLTATTDAEAERAAAIAAAADPDGPVVFVDRADRPNRPPAGWVVTGKRVVAFAGGVEIRLVSARPRPVPVRPPQPFQL